MKVKKKYIDNKALVKSFSLLIMMALFVSCSRNNNPSKRDKNISQATGWKINSISGGFKSNIKYKGQAAGPGLVFVEGGTFTKGNVQDNVMHDWNNTPTQQYVKSFYIDETEVTNEMYVEYLHWMRAVFADKFSDIYKAAHPDTLVWRNPLGFNEDMVNNYLRHPAFQDHPVVGVSWKQASNFAKWRTDRVNEQILVSNGYIKESAINPDSLIDGYSFNTKAYFLDPTQSYGGRINKLAGEEQKEINKNEKINYASRESGLLLPEYRLPTETEWEYAALALSEIRDGNVYRGKKKFPWDGEYTRSDKKKSLGDQLANFKLSKGDYGGIAGWSETGSGITTAVRSYPANDLGLYGMAGNVSEWVADVYRPIIDENANDFNYYRGNVFYKPSIGENGKVILIDSKNATYDNLPGSIKQEIENEDSINRVNYSTGDNRNYNDGDSKSIRNSNLEEVSTMYNSPNSDDISEERTTLISDEARVFKGGSWLDRAYYLDPAQRRFLPENMTTNFIGFRCAMSYLGESRKTSKPRKR